MDEKRKMGVLIRATRQGRRPLDRNRSLCATACTGMVFLIVDLGRPTGACWGIGPSSRGCTMILREKNFFGTWRR